MLMFFATMEDPQYRLVMHPKIQVFGNYKLKLFLKLFNMKILVT